MKYKKEIEEIYEKCLVTGKVSRDKLVASVSNFVSDIENGSKKIDTLIVTNGQLNKLCKEKDKVIKQLKEAVKKLSGGA